MNLTWQHRVRIHVAINNTVNIDTNENIYTSQLATLKPQYAKK